MSVFSGVEAEVSKAEAAIKADVSKVRDELSAVLDHKVRVVIADAQTELEAAKAKAMQDVANAAPEVKAAVEKELGDVEAALLAFFQSHLG